MTKLLIVDDHKLIRECFKKILDGRDDFAVIGCASDGYEALAFCENETPDVILMDLMMPICDGIEATRLIKIKHPHIKVLILSSSNYSEDVSKALLNGADGYVLKDIGTEELIISIKSTLHGFEIIQKDLFKTISFPSSFNSMNKKTKVITINDMEIKLSERELKIIQMVTDGYSNKDISSELFIAEGTVKNAMTEIIAKLQLKDRTQLAVYAIRNKLI